MKCDPFNGDQCNICCFDSEDTKYIELSCHQFKPKAVVTFLRYILFTSLLNKDIDNVYIDSIKTFVGVCMAYSAICLELYCGYKYTMNCMINRIWCLKQL